jgi:hypothetical protein
MKAIHAIFPMLCFLSLSCGGETEIIKLPNLEHTFNDGSGHMLCFVISNPPRNKDSLQNLVTRHFQSLASDEQSLIPDEKINKIKIYAYYDHFYFKETSFTPRSYGDPMNFTIDDIDDHFEDLLVVVRVEPKFNEQEIIFFKKGDMAEKIRKVWIEE